MLVRRDIVTLREMVSEVFISRDSVSSNYLSADVVGCRELVGGCWVVRSCQGCVDYSNLCGEVGALVNVLDTSYCRIPESFEVEFYSGRVNIGSLVNVEELAKHLLDLCREYTVPGYEVTSLLRVHKLSREIRVEGWGEAVEEKALVEVSAGVKYSAGRLSYGSSEYVAIAGVGENLGKIFENVLRVARDRARARSKARGINITEAGKVEVILTREASPALFHEISHLLQADLGTHLLGRKILDHDRISIYDSPGDIGKPSARFFDDEGVTARRRWLVEGGVVLDLHHIIRTAYEAGSFPGSAHGLFHRPRPFHTSLTVGGGDWKEDELVEETRRGFLIDGIAAAFLEEGVVRLIPQVVYRIEKGELGDPVAVRAIKIPLLKPVKVLGLGRDGYTRFSHENSALVTETAPPIKVEAYVEI